MSGAMAGLLSDAIRSPPAVTAILVLPTGGQHFCVGQNCLQVGAGDSDKDCVNRIKG